MGSFKGFVRWYYDVRFEGAGRFQPHVGIGFWERDLERETYGN